MPKHTLFWADIPDAGDECLIEGDEAKHAIRVKRLGIGDIATITDGRGTVAVAEVREARRELILTIRTIDTAEPIRPAVHVCAASPKGPRLEKMIDALSQVGAASWRPLATERGVVDPGENKMVRSERVALESAKQSARPWVMAVEKRITLDRALGSAPSVVMADESGGPYEPSGAGKIALLVGPEGGWTEREVDLARSRGAHIASFGVHTMRIEVAAPVAAAGIIDHERRAAQQDS